MLRKSLLLTLALLLVFSLGAFAGEGSDTVGGGKLLPQLRYGYSFAEWKTHSNTASGFTTWDVDEHNYYAQLNWGIVNNVDLFALIGGRSLRGESEFTRRFFNEIESDWTPMFMWGIGVKATFFRADNGFYVGGGALFNMARSNDFDLKLYEDGVLQNEFPSTLRMYTLTPELHVGYHIKNIGLTPYLGVDYVYSRAVAELEGEGDIELHMKDPVYMFAGADYYLNDRLYINVEGRTNFNDGWGLETGVGYLFDICPKPAPPVVEPAPPIEPKLEPMSKN